LCECPYLTVCVEGMRSHAVRYMVLVIQGHFQVFSANALLNLQSRRFAFARNIFPKKGNLPMKKNENQIVMETVEIAVVEIQQNDTFRCRMENDNATVEKYAERFKEYKEAKDNGENHPYPFTPIRVWENEGTHVLLGGYHRIDAAKKAGLDKILAEIVRGSEDEAFTIAMTDNRSHGLQMSRGDLKYAIEKIVVRFTKDSEEGLVGVSPGVVADMLGCSRGYASEVVGKLVAEGKVPNVEKWQGLDGKTYKVRTKRERKPKAQPDSNETDKPAVEQGNDVQTDSPIETTADTIDEVTFEEIKEQSEEERIKDIITSLNVFVETLTLDGYEFLIGEIGSWYGQNKTTYKARKNQAKQDSIPYSKSESIGYKDKSDLNADSTQKGLLSKIASMRKSWTH